jgi:nucleoside-diphosphate-sugar epimerase
VPTSVNQVFRALAASTGYGREPGYQAARDGDVRHIYLDVAHAASVLNWRPTVGLEEGLKVTVESFAE